MGYIRGLEWRVNSLGMFGTMKHNHQMAHIMSQQDPNQSPEEAAVILVHTCGEIDPFRRGVLLPIFSRGPKGLPSCRNQFASRTHAEADM
jgi:hypothetical protein